MRSRREQSLLILLCVYLGIWAVSVLFFWLLTGPSDAMGYGIVFLWLVLPVAAFVISLLIGRGGYGGRQGWLLPLIFGTMHMLAGYATFMLANMLSVGILRLPQPSLLLKGTIISAAGFWFGALTRRRRRQRAGERRIGEIGQKSRPGGQLFLTIRLSNTFRCCRGAMGRRMSRARSACQLKG